MAVDNPNVIDFIGVDNDSGDVILTISDHLPWDDKNEHILILQEKLNRYLAFVESGELLSSYPDAAERKPVITVVALYHPSKEAEGFINSVKQVVEGAGIGFQFKQKHFNSPA